MIDIHTHIIPGIDDGAKDLEESLHMIRKGYQSGIKTICATPHIPSPSQIDFGFEQRILSGLNLLRTKLSEEKMEVKILLGSEININLDWRSLKDFSFFTLDHSGKFLLLELPLGDIPSFTEETIFNLAIEGYTPIIAHPERSISQDSQIERIERWVNLGALFQLNAGSPLGYFGKTIKRISWKLLKEGLIHFVASDAHDEKNRTIDSLVDAFPLIQKIVGEKKASEIFYQNPKNIIKGEKLKSLSLQFLKE
jgi:protein-tyrosine phosphatase